MIPKKTKKSKRPNRRKFLMAIPPLGGALLGLGLAQTSKPATRQLLGTTPTPLKGVPLPQFSMGERVINPYTDYNDVTVYNQGVVIGMWWNDRDVKDSDMGFRFHGWVYVVHFFEMPLDPHLVPAREMITEDDLQPWGGSR